MPSFTVLTKKITEAPRIDFGDLFNESVAVFQKVWFQGFLLQLITIGLSIPIIIFNVYTSLNLDLDPSSQEFVKGILNNEISMDQFGLLMVV